MEMGEGFCGWSKTAIIDDDAINNRCCVIS